jgi:hypothetical protein
MGIRPSRRRGFAAALAAALAAACAAPPASPPAPVPVAVVDLARVGKLGVLDFAAVGETRLEPEARRAFLAAVRAVQPAAAIVELGPPERVLRMVERERLDADAIRAIGRRYGLDALLVSDFWADTIDPLEFMQRARATGGPIELEGSLAAQIFETREGTRLWSTSATGREPVTRVRLSAWGMKSVESRHLDEVRQQLVDGLVERATADFEPRLTAPAKRQAE